MKKALELGHPTLVHSFFPEKLEELFLNVSVKGVWLSPENGHPRCGGGCALFNPPQRIGGRGSFKTEMSCRRREILFGKKLVLFKKLMVDPDHTDYDFV